MKEEMEFPSEIADQGPRRKSITIPRAFWVMLEQKKLQGKKVLVTVKEI